MAVDLAHIARALGGEVHGSYALVPGPGHSRRDRSLSIRLSDSSPDGYIVHSHCGDDWRLCRDYVADAIGLPRDRWREQREVSPVEAEFRRKLRQKAETQRQAEVARLQRRANAMWNEAQDPRDTVVARYLNSRALDLPTEVAGDVIRFHPKCPWGTGTSPAMVAAMRCIRTGVITAVHRTALSLEGVKLGRKMFGTAGAAAIMLDGEETITTGLAIGEGVETVLAARQLGIKPAWALGSVDAIRLFPVLPGIGTLTVLAENDEKGASGRACRDVGIVWHRAGRSVDVVKPKVGNDLNDVLREGAAA